MTSTNTTAKEALKASLVAFDHMARSDERIDKLEGEAAPHKARLAGQGRPATGKR